MNKLQEIGHMWSRCFPEVGKDWIDRYLESSVNSNDILTIADSESSSIISSLLLQRREMMVYGEKMAVSYLSFACTLPRYRGLGSMPVLLKQALNVARERGDVMVVLIPAASWLRDYYERVGGWATVGYKVERNYVAGRQFPMTGYEDASQAPLSEIYGAFDTLVKKESHCHMLHSPVDFEQVVDDCRGDGGNIYAVKNKATDKIEAVALVYPSTFERVLTVKRIVGHGDACQALLGIISDANPACRLRVLLAVPDNRAGDTRVSSLMPGAMVRVVNPDALLELVARHAPDGWGARVKLTDTQLPENNGTYEIGCGEFKHGNIENLFEVTPPVLARMAFGSSKIGDILSFPSTRPEISLMLE